MYRFKNIMVAFDGSRDSILALAAAESLAKDNKAYLNVAYVHDNSPETVVYPNESHTKADTDLYQSQMYIGPGTSPITPYPGPHPGEFNHKQIVVEDHKPEEVISNAKKRLSSAIDIKYEVLYGKPETELIHFAEGDEVDLIVIGNRGLSGVKKLFMGSVSQKVTNDAACAVFVVK